MDGLLITVIVLAAYIAIISILKYKKLLEKHNMSLWGPILMVRTHKGADIIERAAAHRRFWTVVGPVAIAVCAILAVLLVPLLIWNAALSFQIPVESTPSPALVIGLPGINPIMSGANFWYAILGLVVGIVVHEGLHGVFTRLAGIKLKSVGLLFLAIPLGAFVEPDEEELGKTTRFKRARVFAAGPFANIVLAVIFGMIFSSLMMGAVQIKSEGAGIIYVEHNSPAGLAGISPGMIITNVSDSMGTQIIRNSTDLQKYLSSKKIGDHVVVGTYGGQSYNTMLASAATYTKNQSDANKAYLGVATVGTKDAMKIYNALEHPFSGFGNFLYYILLPIAEFRSGISPLHAPYTDFVITPIAPAFFWPLTIAFYWIFWLSLMLGTTNALPVIPLDGGYIFREGLDWTLSKTKLSEARRSKIAASACYSMTFFIIALIVIQFIGPRLGALFG